MGRLATDKLIGGVVGGLARTYGYSPGVSRLVVGGASALFPPLIGLYLIAWVLLPQDPAPPESLRAVVMRGPRSLGAAVATVVGGAIVVGSVLDDLPSNAFGNLVVAAALIGGGLWLWHREDRSGGDAATPRGPGGTGPWRPNAAPSTPEPWATTPWPPTAMLPTARPPTARPPTAMPPTMVPPSPSSGATPGIPHDAAVVALGVDTPVMDADDDWGWSSAASGPWDTARPAGGSEWTPPPPPEPERPSAPPVGTVTVGAAVVALGMAVAGDRLGWWGFDAGDGAALLLAITGVGLLIGAVIGGGRWLALPALLLAPVVAVRVWVPDVDFVSNGAGERQVTIASAAQAAEGAELGVGQLEVDLSALKPPASGQLVVPVRLGAGEIRITVPDDVRLEARLRVTAGEIRLEGRSAERAGTRFADGLHLDHTWLDEGSGAPDLVLDAQLGFGSLVVERAAPPGGGTASGSAATTSPALTPGSPVAPVTPVAPDPAVATTEDAPVPPTTAEPASSTEPAGGSSR